MTNWTIIKTILTYSDVFKLSFTKDLKNMGEEKVSEFLTDGKDPCVFYTFYIYILVSRRKVLCNEARLR